MQLDSAYMVAVLFSIFRLSGDVSIQMVTALVLQLIQCSVKIPEKPDEMQDAPSIEDGEEDNKPVSIFFKHWVAFMFLSRQTVCCSSETDISPLTFKP